MDEFETPAPTAEDGDDMGFGGDMGASEPLPTFGDAEEAAPMGGMDMGGGDMGGMGGGDMGGMGGGMGGGISADDFTMGPLAEWRKEREEKLAVKAAEADAKHKAKVEEAQGQITAFYAELKDKSGKRAAENLTAQGQYIAERDAAIQADSWDSVCGMVNLKEQAGQTCDTSRLRSILVQLKHK